MLPTNTAKAGSLTFGSGLVIVPFLEKGLVLLRPEWVFVK